jgi:hypothetical protein
MHVFGAVEFPSEVHVVWPVNFLNEYHRDLGFACRGDQRACGASSLLGKVHVGYAVLRAGHVRSAALEVHHDERRFAHDQGPLGIFLLSHTNLVVLKTGRPPARADYCDAMDEGRLIATPVRSTGRQASRWSVRARTVHTFGALGVRRDRQIQHRR